MEEHKYNNIDINQSLIGKKVRGFKFDDKGNDCGYNSRMDDYIGQVGEIYSVGINYCAVEFANDCWNYPSSLIHKHLVEEETTSPQIIDLSNVEGVEMMVSDDKEHWYKEIVIAKYAGSFIDCNCSTWKFSKPIEVKKVTMKQLQKIVGYEFEIVKEVSND